jgi:hypothetical protein
MKEILIFVALALTGSSARSVLFDGAELLAKLQATDPVERAAAVGYVASISDTNEAFFVTNAVRPFSCFSIPVGVTADEVGGVARNWLEMNRSVLGENAISLVSRALAASYPCK